MVAFHNITKRYGDVLAVDDISFSIPAGGIIGLLGPNGAGKTTTMRIMTGFLSPTSGEVRIAERQFDPDSVELKRMIGYLPESAPAYGDMLAYDYLAYEARLHGFDPDTRVPEVVRLVGLGSHAHKPIRELSKGYRQRVGLAHTLIHDPEILVLDEPTSGLDPNQIIEVRALIRRIAETKTVILSTHIMQEVEALCSRVIVIHNGKIRYDGSITAFAGASRRIQLLVSDIELALLREYLTGLPGFTAVEERVAGGDGGPAGAPAPAAGDGAAGGTAPPAAGDGGTLRALTVVTDPDHDLRPQIFRAVADAGGTIYEMVTERTSMEDIFHQLTGNQAVGMEAEPAGTEAEPAGTEAEPVGMEAEPAGMEAGRGAGAAAATKEASRD